MEKLKVGLIGCGMISDTYLQNSRKCPLLEVTAVSDIINERAVMKAREFDIPLASSKEDMMKDPSVDIILNLTTPQSHAGICLSALEAGKHVYTEKPLAVTLQEGKEILGLSRKKGLFVGSAPDTFLGGRLQTCRKLIDEGWIGEPIAASAFCAFHGNEVWHWDPDFLYQEGAGPMFDMGVYYITALVSLLGPVKRVMGNTKKYFDKRTITSQPRYGEKITVRTDTHITGIMEFKSNVTAIIMMSFDVWDPCLPRMEIYGREGTIYIHDADPLGGPNIFGGRIYIRRGKDSDWKGFPTQMLANEMSRKEHMSPLDEIPLVSGYTGNIRGIGLADMAYAIRSGRQNRANGDMALHVLEVILGFAGSHKMGSYFELESTCHRPEPLHEGQGKEGLRLDFMG